MPTRVFFALRSSPLVMVAMAALLIRDWFTSSAWLLTDTLLCTYLLETFALDAVTLLSLRAHHWSGQWRITMVSLALELFPPSSRRVAERMHVIGVAQVGVPAVVTALSAVWFFAGNRLWWSHSGVVMLTSGFVLVTTLLPAMPRVASAGSAVDRLMAPRWAHANWVWAAVLRALDGGAVLHEVVAKHELLSLLPAGGKPLEPVSLLFQTWCCEVGDFETPREFIDAWQLRFGSAPVWLAVDGLKQAAAVYALIDGDVPRAEQCLELVKRLQVVPWYAELVIACIAHAQHDIARRDGALQAWHAAVERHPRRQLLLGANRWVLARLTERLGPAGIALV